MKKLSLRSIVRTDWFVILAIVAIWHFALIGIGFATEMLGNERLGDAFYSSEMTRSPVQLLSHTTRWDSGWLLDVTKNFYEDNPASAAFYPLFPLLVRAIHELSFGTISLVTAGFFVNFAASYFAVLALYRISKKLFDSRQVSFMTSLLFLAFPTAFFMHVFYSEAVFCAIAFWAYYFALQKKWLYMGLLLGLLTSTRLPSILFVGLCGLEYLRSINYRVASFNKDALYFALAPLGFILYGLFLASSQNDFFGMFSAYEATDDWSYQVFDPNIFHTIGSSLKSSFYVLTQQATLTNGTFTNNVLPSLAIFFTLATSVFAIVKIRRFGIPLGIFGIVSIVMFTLNSNTVSVHRYILPVLTNYVVLGWLYQSLLKRKNSSLHMLFPALIGVLLMGQIFLYLLFVNWYFVG